MTTPGRDVCHLMRMKVRTNLMLSAELVGEVDRLAGARGRSRFVEEAVRERLRRERARRLVESTIGVLDPAEHPEWSTPDKVVAWVREQRAAETDAGPGGGARQDRGRR